MRCEVCLLCFPSVGRKGYAGLFCFVLRELSIPAPTKMQTFFQPWLGYIKCWAGGFPILMTQRPNRQAMSSLCLLGGVYGVSPSSPANPRGVDLTTGTTWYVKRCFYHHSVFLSTQSRSKRVPCVAHNSVEKVG